MGKNEKKGLSGVYVPVLLVLLLVAVFFVGRLSSKIKTMEKAGEKIENSAGKKESPIKVAGLKKIAGKLGLDKKKFNSCLDEGKYEQKIKDDAAYGNQVKVSGTPSFFINKVMVVGSQPQETFEAVIDFELAGGDWDRPTKAVSYLVDGDPDNGEVTIVDGLRTGVGAVKGPADAKVKIVEFSDFECPFCLRSEPTIKDLFKEYGDKISLEYRYFPLLSIHPHAQKAAEAAECAREQGKFWEMHDRMFEVQK